LTGLKVLRRHRRRPSFPGTRWPRTRGKAKTSACCTAACQHTCKCFPAIFQCSSR